MPASMRLLFERDGIFVVDKPAGLPSTGRDLDDPDCAQYMLARELGRRVWAVHQLDRATSGVLLFTSRKTRVAELQRALTRGRKVYLALVDGVVVADRRCIDAPMRYVRGRGRPAVVPDGKEARTQVIVRERGEWASLVEVCPRTGRTHQIRVHLAHIGHPIVGDALHGHGADARMGLHCWRIGLDGQRFEAPLPADFRALCQSRGLTLKRL